MRWRMRSGSRVASSLTCDVGEETVAPRVLRSVDRPRAGHEREEVAKRGHQPGREQRGREGPLRALHLPGHRARIVPEVEVPEQRVEEEAPIVAPPPRQPPRRPQPRHRHRHHQHERRQRRQPQRHRGVPHDGQPRVVEEGERQVHPGHRRVPRRAAGNGRLHPREVVGAEDRKGGAVNDAAEELPGPHQ